ETVKKAKERKDTLELTNTKPTDEEEQLPKNIIRDRLIVIGILTFFSIFFWMAFEQAGSSMTFFANDYAQRILVGNQAIAFKGVDAALTIFPLILLTWVLTLLAKQIIKKYPLSIFFSALSFFII